MYTLNFTNWEGEQETLTFDDCSDAVNAAVQMQVMEGGYNTSGDWYYEITNEDGEIVYGDECARYFD